VQCDTCSADNAAGMAAGCYGDESPQSRIEITDDSGRDLDKCAEGSLMCREMSPRDAETDPDMHMLLCTNRHARKALLDAMLENGISCALGIQIAEQVNHQCPYSSDRSEACQPPCEAFVNMDMDMEEASKIGPSDSIEDHGHLVRDCKEWHHRVLQRLQGGSGY